MNQVFLLLSFLFAVAEGFPGLIYGPQSGRYYEDNPFFENLDDAGIFSVGNRHRNIFGGRMLYGSNLGLLGMMNNYGGYTGQHNYGYNFIPRRSYGRPVGYGGLISGSMGPLFGNFGYGSGSCRTYYGVGIDGYCNGVDLYPVNGNGGVTTGNIRIGRIRGIRGNVLVNTGNILNRIIVMDD